MGRRGEGRDGQYAAALLYNGLGHYDKALAAAELASEYDDTGVLGWSLTELVEAAVRSSQPARASDALQRLSETTRASGTDWALGTEARSRALLSEGETAENCYREAIERLGRTRMRPAVARAHLLYGEWLRRVHQARDRLTRRAAAGPGGQAHRPSGRRPRLRPATLATAQIAGQSPGYLVGVCLRGHSRACSECHGWPRMLAVIR